MITEDQLEQLAIQWFQDTGGENIDPSSPVGYAGTRHRTPNMERRSEEKGRLEEAVRRLNPFSRLEFAHFITKSILTR